MKIILCTGFSNCSYIWIQGISLQAEFKMLNLQLTVSTFETFKNIFIVSSNHFMAILKLHITGPFAVLVVGNYHFYYWKMTGKPILNRQGFRGLSLALS